MITLRSPLDLDDFAIVRSTYEFNIPENNSDIKRLFAKYPVDIDYTISNTDDELSFQLYVKIEVNIDQKLAGYSIAVEGVGFFSFEKDVTTDDKRSLINFSGISICINSIRGYISSMTSHSPMGRYLLPSVDINHLIDLKASSLEQNENLVDKPKKNKKK